MVGLKNMRRALKPGGTMTMIAWRAIEDNPWLGLPKEIVLNYLPPPGEDARTCGPGPFSMADREMVTKRLEIAGEAYREAGAEAERRHGEIEAALLTGLGRYANAEGIVMDSSSRKITARNPE